MNKTGGLINQCLCAVILCLWGAVECRGETPAPSWGGRHYGGLPGEGVTYMLSTEESIGGF